MSDLRSLYQEIILDHGKAPRNFGVLSKATHCRKGHNPLCGDELTLYIDASQDRIHSLRFEGKGCAISMASASLMTEALEGRTILEAEQLFADFHVLVTDQDHPSDLEESVGKLAAFRNLAEFPVRVKCATLAWHTLRAALSGSSQPVSTE